MITGILIDVSGSMENKLTDDKANSAKKNVGRVEAAFNSIANIIKEDSDKDIDDETMFVLAFGLSDETYGHCDLINLFDLLPSASFKSCYKLLEEYEVKDIKSHIVVDDDNSSSKAYIVGYEPLIKMLKQNGAPYCDEYVTKHLPKKQAGDLFLCFSERKDLLIAMVDKLPYACKSASANGNTQGSNNLPDINLSDFDPMKHLLNFFGYKVESAILPNIQLINSKETMEKKEHEEAMGLLRTITNLISEPICKIPTKPRPRSRIIEVIDKLSLRYKLSSDDDKSSEDENKSSSDGNKLSSLDANKLIKHIRPYIYGRTPMCRSLQYAKDIFKLNDEKNTTKVLLIISDGEPTDGDPIALMKDFGQSNIIIICCFITSKHILKPKALYDTQNNNWDKGAKTMFNMASTISNSNPAISLLLKNGWEVPSSGQSRLFVQANHPDIIDEFCRIARHIS